VSVSPNDVISVVIEAALNDGSIVQNRKRFKLESAVTKSDAEILNAVKTWVDTLYAFFGSYINQDVSLEDGTVDVIAWNPATSIWEVIQNVGIYSPLDTFASLGDELPNQCAAFVIGNTSRPKSKGRLFAFPFSVGTQDEGILTSAVMVAMANFAAQYITYAAVGGDSLVSGIVRETVDQWLPFLTASFNDVIGTQRRRRRGVGI